MATSDVHRSGVVHGLLHSRHYEQQWDLYRERRDPQYIKRLRLLALLSVVVASLLEVLGMSAVQHRFLGNGWDHLISIVATLLLCGTSVFVAREVSSARSIMRVLLLATALLLVPGILDLVMAVRGPVLPEWLASRAEVVTVRNVVKMSGLVLFIIGFYLSIFEAFDAKRMLAHDSRELMLEGMEREQTQKALQASEQRFRRVLENSRDIIFELNLATRKYEYISPSVVQLTGYSVSEAMMMGQTEFSERVHPDDRIRRVIHLKEALSSHPTGRPLAPLEYRLLLKSGDYRWFSDSWNVVRDANGRPLALVGTARDVTKRKLAEQALRESETRNRALLNAIPDLMYLVHRDGTALDLRNTAGGLVGHEATGTAWVRVEEGLPGELGRQTMKYFTRAMETGRIQVLDYEFMRDGELRHCEARFVASGPDEVLVIIRDTTHHNRLEREILEISALEQRRIGQDLHDGLGQHLTGILCLSTSISNSLQDKALPEAEAAQEIAHLVKQAIAMSRSLAKGLCPVELEAHGLAAALEDLARRTQKLFNVSCVFKCNEYAPVVNSTIAEHLYRIAQESVSNAMKYAEAEQIVISLESVEDRIVLTVRDDGVGLPEHAREGKGMGLRIMEYRARMMGASLLTARNPQGGTRISCAVSRKA